MTGAPWALISSRIHLPLRYTDTDRLQLCHQPRHRDLSLVILHQDEEALFSVQRKRRGVFRPGGATRADRLAWAIRPWGDGRYPFSVGVVMTTETSRLPHRKGHADEDN